MRLPRHAVSAVSLEVAPVLLGATIVHDAPHGLVAVRLSEVEAYGGPLDPGSHAYRGRTPRNAVMFGPAGHLYVYFTYGMHWCANVVCGPHGEAGAVLLRGGEVVRGLDVARRRRPSARRDVDLARGPARLAAALGLDREQDGADLCTADGPLWLEPAQDPTSEPAGERPAVRAGPRVGVSGEGGDADRFPWRFWLEGDPTVSVYRPAQPRRRPAGRPDTLRSTPAPTERTFPP